MKNLNPIHFNEAQNQASETAKTTEAVNATNETIKQSLSDKVTSLDIENSTSELSNKLDDVSRLTAENNPSEVVKKLEEVKENSKEQLNKIIENTMPKDVQKMKFAQPNKDIANAFFSMLKGDKGDSIKGEDGKTPSKEELVSLIKPLIPEPIKGKDGKDADEKQIVQKVLSKIPIPKDGKNADEEVIVDKVLGKIILPEYKETVLDTGEEIINKLNPIKNSLNFEILTNIPDFALSKDVVGYRGGDGGGGQTLTFQDEGTRITDNPITTLNVTGATGALTYSGNGVATLDITANLSGYLQNNIGIAGGTTLIGGIAASENLTLQSTSNATKGKILFGTSGYDEVNNRLGIGNTSPSVALEVGSTTVGQSAIINSSLGSNIVTNGTFTTDLTGWTGAGWSQSAGTAVHSSGTTALTQAAATVTINTVYKLTFDLVYAGTGSLTPSCGGMTGTAYAASGTTITWYFTATATIALAFTPTTGFTGSIDNVTLQAISEGKLSIGDNITGVTAGKSLRFTKTLSDPYSNEMAFKFEYTTNKSTSGDDTGLLINKTDTNSPGTSNLVDFQLAGVSQFRVQPNGITVNRNIFVTPTVRSASSNTTLTLQTQTRSSAGNMILMTNGTFSNSIGVGVAVAITPTYNQTSTGAGTDLLINRTETVVGSGAQLLIDTQVGGVSRFAVDNLGNLTLEGQTAKTISEARNTTSNTAGNNLTLNAGGATVAATDKNGGMVTIQPGISTGTGMGSVRVKRLTRAASTGTADNTLVDAHIIAAEVSIASETSVNLFEVSLPAGSGAGGLITYQLVANDGTDFIVHSGHANYAMVNKGGVYTTQIADESATEDANATSVLEGAIVETWSATSGTNKVTVSVSVSCTNLVANDIKIYYTVHNGSRQTITQL